jgi:hypothetical protein
MEVPQGMGTHTYDDSPTTAENIQVRQLRPCREGVVMRSRLVKVAASRILPRRAL